jgi:hypothetical protein
MNTKDQQRYGTALSQEALLLKIGELKHILDTVRILILDWSYTFPLIEMTRFSIVGWNSFVLLTGDYMAGFTRELNP